MARVVAIRTAVLVLGLLAAAVASAAPWFHHDIDSGPRPWTDRNFDDAEGKFTFAVFSALTGGEREGVYDVAVAQLNLLRPEFVVNVGDLLRRYHVDTRMGRPCSPVCA